MVSPSITLAVPVILASCRDAVPGGWRAKPDSGSQAEHRHDQQRGRTSMPSSRHRPEAPRRSTRARPGKAERRTHRRLMTSIRAPWQARRHARAASRTAGRRGGNPVGRGSERNEPKSYRLMLEFTPMGTQWSAGGDMRRVILGETGIEASCLGFGCAGLGSRINAADGAPGTVRSLRGGVTWFDLAPVYGAGQAEAIAAPFLRAHRAEVQIATKAGLAPGRGYGGGPGARKAAPVADAGDAARYRLCRPAAPVIAPRRPECQHQAAANPGAADRLARGEPAPAGHRSGRALRAARPDRRRGGPRRHSPRARGHPVRRQGAGDLGGGGRYRRGGGSRHWSSLRCNPARTPPPGRRTAEAAARANGFGRITHSVFGVGGTWDALRRRLAADPSAERRLAGKGATPRRGWQRR